MISALVLLLMLFISDSLEYNLYYRWLQTWFFIFFCNFAHFLIYLFSRRWESHRPYLLSALHSPPINDIQVLATKLVLSCNSQIYVQIEEIDTYLSLVRPLIRVHLIVPIMTLILREKKSTRELVQISLEAFAKNKRNSSKYGLTLQEYKELKSKKNSGQLR